MTKFLFLCGLLGCSFLSTAEIYKWVDENGRVHFGDSPKQSVDAEEVKVKVNSYEHVTPNLDEFQSKDPKASQRVTMYSTSWCGYCKKARQYFRSNKISFVEYDIEKNEVAKQEYDRLGGRGVPLILVGDQKMSGFDPYRFDRMMKGLP